jgi:5-methylcytosine-specific restriction endonuclease McrA
MGRQEFSDKTKRAAWDRCGGICECGCLKPIHRAQYDHIVPCGLGGGNDLDNCQVLTQSCHAKKTRKRDVPSISKAVRIIEKRAGLRKSKRPFPKRVNAWNS